MEVEFKFQTPCDMASCSKPRCKCWNRLILIYYLLSRSHGSWHPHHKLVQDRGLGRPISQMRQAKLKQFQGLAQGGLTCKGSIQP